MIVITQHKKNKEYHIYLKVDKIEYLDNFYNDEDSYILSKIEKIYENGATRSKGILINKEFQLITIEKLLDKNIETIEELAQKNQFVIHRNFL